MTLVHYLEYAYNTEDYEPVSVGFLRLHFQKRGQSVFNLGNSPRVVKQPVPAMKSRLGQPVSHGLVTKLGVPLQGVLQGVVSFL